MATKHIELPTIGSVKLYKRKGVRSIRLSVTSHGEVRVTMPYWLPYDAGLAFVRSKQAWIAAHLKERKTLLIHGQAIGKSHRLYFEERPLTAKVATRVTQGAIYITHPVKHSATDKPVQDAATRAAVRALRIQAETYLPGRLAELSGIHQLPYSSVQIKQLRGRWGSCDTSNNIVLNLFLMQLPWELIDYVLLHELTHTKILRHGPDFWRELERYLPNANSARRAIRAHKPVVC